MLALLTSYFRAKAKITEEHIFILEIECNILKYHAAFNEKGNQKSDEIKKEEHLAVVDLTFYSVSSCFAVVIVKLLKTYQNKYTYLLWCIRGMLLRTTSFNFMVLLK